MYLVLALAAAASWGASDFIGGLIGRRVPGASVAFASQAVGLAALVVLAPLVAASASGRDLAWGAAAGVGGAAGVALLYHGLAVGQMSVVAPVTAVGAASIPVLFGLATGERPSAAALIGVVLALVAVGVLCAFPGRGEGDGAKKAVVAEGDGAGGAGVVGAGVSSAGAVGAEKDGPRRAEVGGAAEGAGRGVGSPGAGLAAGVASGIGFGAFFICLDRSGEGAGLWPLVGARVVSVLLLGALVIATRRALVPGEGSRGAVVLTGALDVTANTAFLLASRRGLLSIVALLASLYPAGTVLLARLVLHERLSRAQALGLAGAGGAVALIALS